MPTWRGKSAGRWKRSGSRGHGWGSFSEDEVLDRSPHPCVRLGDVVQFVLLLVGPPARGFLLEDPLDPGLAVGHLDGELGLKEARPTRFANPDGRMAAPGSGPGPGEPVGVTPPGSYRPLVEVHDSIVRSHAMPSLRPAK